MREISLSHRISGIVDISEQRSYLHRHQTRGAMLYKQSNVLFDNRRGSVGGVKLAWIKELFCSSGQREIVESDNTLLHYLLHKYTNIRCKAIHPHLQRLAGDQFSIVVTFYLPSHRHYLQSPSVSIGSGDEKLALQYWTKSE